MFTGIVQGTRQVVSVERREGFATLVIQLGNDLCRGLKAGASVAINGVCLTVTECSDESASFDVMQETLRVTNLADVQADSMVNVERAARFGDEIGGHSLSGHVHDTVTIASIEKSPDNTTVTFEFDARWQDYLLPKGYVSLNGASLTIGPKVVGQRFSVHLIPETLRMTSFGQARVGDRVNLEIDSQTQAIVDTVKTVLERQQAAMV